MDTVDTKNCFEPEEGEKIIEIEMERLRTFRNHPFKVRMDDEMVRLIIRVMADDDAVIKMVDSNVQRAQNIMMCFTVAFVGTGKWLIQKLCWNLE